VEERRLADDSGATGHATQEPRFHGFKSEKYHLLHIQRMSFMRHAIHKFIIILLQSSLDMINLGLKGRLDHVFDRLPFRILPWLQESFWRGISPPIVVIICLKNSASFRAPRT
jgi:hypothetical protein